MGHQIHKSSCIGRTLSHLFTIRPTEYGIANKIHFPFDRIRQVIWCSAISSDIFKINTNRKTKEIVYGMAIVYGAWTRFLFAPKLIQHFIDVIVYTNNIWNVNVFFFSISLFPLRSQHWSNVGECNVWCVICKKYIYYGSGQTVSTISNCTVNWHKYKSWNGWIQFLVFFFLHFDLDILDSLWHCDYQFVISNWLNCVLVRLVLSEHRNYLIDIRWTRK